MVAYLSCVAKRSYESHGCHYDSFRSASLSLVAECSRPSYLPCSQPHMHQHHSHPVLKSSAVYCTDGSRSNPSSSPSYPPWCTFAASMQESAQIHHTVAFPWSPLSLAWSENEFSCSKWSYGVPHRAFTSLPSHSSRPPYASCLRYFAWISFLFTSWWRPQQRTKTKLSCLCL